MSIAPSKRLNPSLEDLVVGPRERKAKIDEAPLLDFEELDDAKREYISKQDEDADAKQDEDPDFNPVDPEKKASDFIQC
jgi:hypothetical protein